MTDVTERSCIISLPFLLEYFQLCIIIVVSIFGKPYLTHTPHPLPLYLIFLILFLCNFLKRSFTTESFYFLASGSILSHSTPASHRPPCEVSLVKVADAAMDMPSVSKHSQRGPLLSLSWLWPHALLILLFPFLLFLKHLPYATSTWEEPEGPVLGLLLCSLLSFPGLS